jgi:hypothetical protein
MNGELARFREKIMEGVSDVRWPDVHEIRAAVRRRRARRMVACCAALAVVGVALTVLAVPGLPGRFVTSLRGQPEMLQPEDVGSGYTVNVWGTFGDTRGGTRPEEAVLEWPSPWLTGCPAYEKTPPVGFRYHTGGRMIGARPPAATLAPYIDEYLLGFTGPAAAEQVLVEVRSISRLCATYTVGDHVKYTASVVAEGFAGVDAVQLELTEAAFNRATGQQVGAPASHMYVFVRVANAVIMLIPSMTADSEWRQNLASAAADRYCAAGNDC